MGILFGNLVEIMFAFLNVKPANNVNRLSKLAKKEKEIHVNIKCKHEV